MKPEEEQYYETYFDLFMTDGWKQFVGEIQEIFDGYQIEHIKDEKELSRIKGERAMLRKVLHFEGGIKSAYNLITERENDKKV